MWCKNSECAYQHQDQKAYCDMSQMLPLGKHELDLLAAFLGHDIHVHQEFYRLPEQTLQVPKVSKLLLAMERGETVTLQGRNFNGIDVDVPGQSLICWCICKQLLRIVEEFYFCAYHPTQHSHL